MWFKKKYKVGLFRNPPSYNGNYTSTIETLGHNTGNLAFWSAIEKLLKAEMVPYYNITKDLNNKYDKLIITDLIWVRQNYFGYEHLEELLDIYKKAIIPISVGLQCNEYNPNFVLHPRVITLLERIQERCIIGVRGEYTASILDKHGITNIKTIGCPSIYYMNDENFQIQNNSIDEIRLTTNFKTFYSVLTQKEKEFLDYCVLHDSFFIEQSHNQFTIQQAGGDESYFNYLNDWLKYNSHIFYKLEDWNKNICNYNFSIGLRFHGNIMALRNNLKSLFISCDSRTKELIDFFDLPSINIEEFDGTKDINYYYDLADYTNFNKSYKKKLQNFKEFLYLNGINLKLLR